MYSQLPRYLAMVLLLIYICVHQTIMPDEEKNNTRNGLLGLSIAMVILGLWDLLWIFALGGIDSTSMIGKSISLIFIWIYILALLIAFKELQNNNNGNVIPITLKANDYEIEACVDRSSSRNIAVKAFATWNDKKIEFTGMPPYENIDAVFYCTEVDDKTYRCVKYKDLSEDYSARRLMDKLVSVLLVVFLVLDVAMLYLYECKTDNALYFDNIKSFSMCCLGLAFMKIFRNNKDLIAIFERFAGVLIFAVGIASFFLGK